MECDTAFGRLKTCLTSTPFILETDASLTGLGAVLSRQQDQRVVIAFASISIRLGKKDLMKLSSYLH